MLSRMIIGVAAVAALVIGTADAKSSFASMDVFDAYYEENDAMDLAHMISSSINLADAVFEPLDLSQELDRRVYDAMISDPDFLEYRDQKYLTSHGISANQFDLAFEGAREALLSTADMVGVSVDLKSDSYEDVLDKITISSTLQNSQLLQSSEFVALYTNSIFFEGFKNLEEPVLQDMLTAMPPIVSKFIDFLVRVINQYKCSWCKSIVNQIRKKLCKVAGELMCGLAARAFGPLEPVAFKYACHSPLNVSSIFGGWCQTGVKYIQRQTGWTDNKICSFSIPRFSVAGKSIGIGRIC